MYKVEIRKFGTKELVEILVGSFELESAENKADELDDYFELNNVNKFALVVKIK